MFRVTKDNQSKVIYLVRKWFKMKLKQKYFLKTMPETICIPQEELEEMTQKHSQMEGNDGLYYRSAGRKITRKGKLVI